MIIILTIIGPPQPPAPEVEAVNATTLRFFGETPLSWEEFLVEMYRIRLINNSSGEIIVDKTTVALEFLYQWDDGDSENYHQLIFTVTASNAVGSSTIGSVNGGSFPIGTNTYAATLCFTMYTQNTCGVGLGTTLAQMWLSIVQNFFPF